MNHTEPLFWVLLLVSSLLLTLLLVPWVIRLAHRLGAVDQPDRRKVHQHAMPRMGGLAFALPLFFLPLSLHTSLPPSAQADLVGFLLGLLGVVICGVADDIRGITPKAKFIGQGASALLFVLLTDTAISNLGDLLGLGAIKLGWLAIPFTVVVMTGLINALNLSDGLDGLATGIALIAVFFLGFLGGKAGDMLTAVLSVVLLGGMLGFLYFNSHPAKVFMGDTGSLVLGYVLGAVALLLLKQTATTQSPIQPVTLGMLLALPLGDTVYVMVRRIREGRRPFSPDKTHFHHRLLALGLSHNGVVGVLYGMMMLYGIAAVLLVRQAAWVQFLVLVGLLVGSYGLLGKLERSGGRLYVDEMVRKSHGKAGNHTGSWLARLSGVSVPYVTWMIPLLLLYPTTLLEISDYLKLLVGGGIVSVGVLFPWRNGHAVSSWTCGLYYWLVFIPVLLINVYGDEFSKSFLLASSVVLAVWVGVKLYFRQHREILLTTGLELLLVLLSWVAPWLVTEFGMVPQERLPELYNACFQAIVFLLATKIVLRRQVQRNRQLLYSLFLLNGLLLL